MTTTVSFYIPNLLCWYARILLAFAGLVYTYAETNPVKAAFWGISALLNLFDVN